MGSEEPSAISLPPSASGLLLIDKPAGPTSHDVVEQVRRTLGESKIGHAGTLDPPATGLLVLAVGVALKFLEFLEHHEKEYESTFHLGRTTDTDDATGNVLSETDASHRTREQVESALTPFRGEIEQRVPAYSAVKVQGKRLHALARKGDVPDLPVRRVTIHELTLLDWTPPLARLRIRCSKGTYIRAIARDLGGSVETLRRTASGPFRVEDSLPADSTKETLEAALLAPDTGLMSLPEIRVSTDEALSLQNGRLVGRAAPAGLHRLYLGPRFLGVGDSTTSHIAPRKILR